jgi:hypothetical protein
VVAPDDDAVQIDEKVMRRVLTTLEWNGPIILKRMMRSRKREIIQRSVWSSPSRILEDSDIRALSPALQGLITQPRHRLSERVPAPNLKDWAAFLGSNDHDGHSNSYLKCWSENGHGIWPHSLHERKEHKSYVRIREPDSETR